MADDCCASSACTTDTSPRFRRVLWWALGINLLMFGIEVIAGVISGSMSLQADALDFLGDAANYGISLAVLGLGLRVRAGAAMLKGLSMGAFGIWVTGNAVYRIVHGIPPDASIMGAVAVLALLANVGVAALLYRFRNGDSNMQSVWICSRNDVIANLAVLVAAGGVAITGTRWPDLVIAMIIAGLALTGAWRVVRVASGELRTA